MTIFFKLFYSHFFNSLVFNILQKIFFKSKIYIFKLFPKFKNFQTVSKKSSTFTTLKSQIILQNIIKI